MSGIPPGMSGSFTLDFGSVVFEIDVLSGGMLHSTCGGAKESIL